MTKTKSVISIYLTNLGKYNEGKLIGEWVALPITEEELAAVKERIGINEHYEEWFITDYESDLNIQISEYANITSLNTIAAQLADFDEYDLDRVNFLLSNGYSLKNALDSYEDVMIFYDCYNDYDFGYAYAEETGLLLGQDEFMQRYFDFEAFGRDLSFDGMVDCINGNYYVLWY